MEKVIIKISHSARKFDAYLPALDGCISTGSTRVEVIKNINDAVKLQVESSLEDNDPLQTIFLDVKYDLGYQFDMLHY